jgi:CheY-like chemotaxis protein
VCHDGRPTLRGTASMSTERLPGRDASEAPETPSTPTPDGQTPRRIVCVDDEDIVLRLFTRILESDGHHVEPFGRAVDALARIRRQPPDVDLLVTDETMPTMTGTQLARLLETSHPELPVLLVSGYAERRPDKHPTNIKRFVKKPTDPDTLLEAVRELTRELP